MPRLSLYRPEKTKDFKFFDRTIYEMFQVGGVDLFVHKYIGPTDPSDPSKAMGETVIQDVIFLENRDRKYDPDIYTIRGHYQTQDIDFNLSQFGLFLQNDTVFLTVHINNSVDLLGRKIMTGDVFELPNLREEYFLETGTVTYLKAIKKFYVVEEINRAAEGFSATWYPHLYRIKLKPMTDSQEFKDILDQPENTDNYAGTFDPTKIYYPGQTVTYQGVIYTVLDSVGPEGTSVAPPDPTYWGDGGNSLRDLMSTYQKALDLNNAAVAIAEADAPLSGYETSHFFTLSVDPLTGKAAVNTVDNYVDNIASSFNIADIDAPPVRDGYKGYLIEDGIPPNGPMGNTNAQFGFGIQFPYAPVTGDNFLRTDYLPNRLFKFDGVRWIKQEDNVRMTLSNTNDRQTLKTSFINNQEFSGINQVASDVVFVDSVNGNRFDSGVTQQFDVNGATTYVRTSLDYNAKYKVEIWADETMKITQVTNLPAVNGKFAFRIDQEIPDNVQVRYTVYAGAVQQKQSLSKALRFKPRADE
jgi:hypothetical protein